jgi:hypothetical protein
VDPDPDPGGPKTRGSGGSGSATLVNIMIRINSVKHTHLLFIKEYRTGTTHLFLGEVEVSHLDCCVKCLVIQLKTLLDLIEQRHQNKIPRK